RDAQDHARGARSPAPAAPRPAPGRQRPPPRAAVRPHGRDVVERPRPRAPRQAAERAAAFLLGRLRAPDGRLLRTYRNGQAKLPAYLEDYAFLAHGLLQLHAATRDARWLREARSLTERM